MWILEWNFFFSIFILILVNEAYTHPNQMFKQVQQTPSFLSLHNLWNNWSWKETKPTLKSDTQFYLTMYSWFNSQVTKIVNNCLPAHCATATKIHYLTIQMFCITYA